MGGINDMAAWTQLVWDTSIQMAQIGPDNCHIEKNPMNIYCNETKVLHSSHLGEYPEEKVREVKTKFFQHLKTDLGINDLHKFAQEIINVEENGDKGVLFKIDKLHFHEKLEEMNDPTKINEEEEPMATLSLSVAFANLGQALHKADLDNDGGEDLIIGAPGYQEQGRQHQGCIFFFYDMASLQTRVENLPRICAQENDIYGRFGHSIATLDVNEDGHLDLIVGSSRRGTETLKYHGSISIFHGDSNRNFVFSHSQINEHESSNMGSSLTVIKDDLFTSGIYFSESSMRQIGFIQSLDESQSIQGSTSYSWTGKSLVPLDDGKIAMSAHMTKIKDVNTVGEVKILDDETLEEIASIVNPDGHSDQFGFDMILTNLMINNDMKRCLVIGAPVASYGSHLNAGALHIFDSKTYDYYGKMHSNRALGRFGSSFAQTDDFWFVGAPRYHEEKNALREQGAVFAFPFAQSLPLGDITTHCASGQNAPCIEEWTYKIFTPPNGLKRTLFGYKILSLNNDFLVISAPRDGTLAQQGGTVFIYNLKN